MKKNLYLTQHCIAERGAMLFLSLLSKVLIEKTDENGTVMPFEDNLSHPLLSCFLPKINPKVPSLSLQKNNMQT